MLDTMIEKAVGAVRKGTDVESVIRGQKDEVVELYELIYGVVYVAFAEIRYEAPLAKQAPDNLLADWLAAAHEFVEGRPIGKRITHVLDTTIEWVNGITSEALAEGLSTDQAARLIVERWTEGDIALHRAEKIARTETISASNAGGQQGAIDSGLNMLHYWISSLDGRVREAHDTSIHPELLNPIPMTQAFIVDGEALAFPGDPAGSAGNTIQCRCVEGYVVP